jgi:ATP-dependent protease hslVU, ATPase subunit
MNDELTPRRIVEYLDQYIIGQQDAKKSVAVALRNRWRASKLSPEIAKEVSPKNILLIGPTGVGKTEIARRIASLTNAPFVKVEATKYTEVGYVGRDVESMVRDLAEESVRLVKKTEADRHKKDAEEAALKKIQEAMWPSKKTETRSPMDIIFGEKEAEPAIDQGEKERRKDLLERIRSGELDDRMIEIEVEDKSGTSGDSDNEQANQISMMLSNMMPKKTRKKRVTVRQAKSILAEEAAEEMVDMEVVKEKAIRLAEERGIIFIDEIDKIAGRNNTSGADVSREGVQRDILPIVEGATVKTKYGQMKTDHILFIAAGAFHVSKPSDLIPELQGRFPVRVELSSLTKEDLRKILTEPRQALIRQYESLLETEGVTITFTESSLDAIAEIATHVNEETEDIGARRLYTILERVLEDISFEAPDLEDKNVTIDGDYIREKMGRITQDIDVSNYIL